MHPSHSISFMNSQTLQYSLPQKNHLAAKLAPFNFCFLNHLNTLELFYVVLKFQAFKASVTTRSENSTLSQASSVDALKEKESWQKKFHWRNVSRQFEQRMQSPSLFLLRL